LLSKTSPSFFFGYDLDSTLFSKNTPWRNQIGIPDVSLEETFNFFLRWITQLHADAHIPENIGVNFHFKNMNNLFEHSPVLNAFFSAVDAFSSPFSSICHIPIEKEQLPTKQQFVPTLRAQLQQCETLKSCGLVVHPPETRNDTSDIFICEFTSPEILSVLNHSQIAIYIENAQSSGTYFQDLGHLVRLRTQLLSRLEELNEKISPDRIKFCFDTGHYLLFQQRDGNGTLDWEKNSSSFLKDVDVFHIHSNDGTKDQHLLPYTQAQPLEKHLPFNFKDFFENCHQIVKWLEKSIAYRTPGNKFYILEINPPFERKELSHFWFHICAKLHLGC